MVRWGVLAAAVAVLGGAALVGRASVPPEPQQPAESKPAASGQKVGLFHMPRVLREYKWAAKQFQPLEDRRTLMTANLAAWRKQFVELQQELFCGHLEVKENRDREFFALARKIEVEDKKVRALLTDATALLATGVHDHIRAEVAELARERGLIAVHAHPVTTEELLSPRGIKELKLKPPGPQPFYVHPSIDYTDELIKRLNAKLAADGGKE